MHTCIHCNLLPIIHHPTTSQSHMLFTVSTHMLTYPTYNHTYLYTYIHSTRASYGRREGGEREACMYVCMYYIWSISCSILPSLCSSRERLHPEASLLRLSPHPVRHSIVALPIHTIEYSHEIHRIIHRKKKTMKENTPSHIHT